MHKSQQKRCNSLKSALDSKMLVLLVLRALLSVQLYKGESSLNVHGQTKKFLVKPRSSWFEPVLRPELHVSTRKKGFFKTSNQTNNQEGQKSQNQEPEPGT